jgi:hypothetical protein
MMNKSVRVWAVLAMVLGLALATGYAAANGPVDPPEVAGVLYPGESLEVDKYVTTPPIPPIVDICLLEDETGSFWDDIQHLQTPPTASDIYDNIVATSPDAQFAVAGFRDYPVDPYGDPGDWVYRLLSGMSGAKANWLAGIAALTAGGGNDGPEAQYDAIVAAAGPGSDDCGWRDPTVVKGVQRVIVVTTDAPFHTPDGTHLNDSASTITALNAANIVVIGLKAPGAGGELDTLAAATGGSVQPLSSDGANIAQAILDALAELRTDVWWTDDCAPWLSVSLTPDVHYDVPGETTVSFHETIAVPNATDPADYNCSVTFWANEYPEDGAEIAEQDIHIEVNPIPVPLDIKPTSCPNPLNTGSKGVLPVAILGTEDLDVTTIDPSTLLLEGVAPLRWNLSDVATPFEPWVGKADCQTDCTDAGPDGYMDLTLKFQTQEVMAALGGVTDGECRVLFLTGRFFDLRSIEGEDVVLFLDK